jgi:hypothetical protein
MAKQTAAVKEASAIDTQLVKHFKAARRVSTPIIAIETPDPAETIKVLAPVMNGANPVFQWDIVRGMRSSNDVAEQAAVTLGISPEATINCTEMLSQALKLPAGSVVFMHGAQHQLGDVAVTQAIWNLRDEFKANKRTLVMLSPAFQIPADIAGDTIVFNEPLPTRAELRAIVLQQYRNAGLAEPVEQTMSAILDAVVGLHAFTAEQVIAMSLTRNGCDVDRCWDHKRKAIENTDGLRVWKGGESFDELRGIDNVKSFMAQLTAAKAFGAIVFIDEADKALAGGMSDYSGDSGVAKDQIGVLLSYIEDTKSLGVMFAGLAGTGKTQLAKAVGELSGKPVIVFDTGAMKGGTVGQSERAIRSALKVVSATAEGRVLFIMTANKTTQFTPEINRRFPDQFFFDQPDAEGCAAIGSVYIEKNQLTPAQVAEMPWSEGGWTGAEIKRACERAALFNVTVSEAARFLVPQSVSQRDKLDEMRRNAAGKFLSASKPGVYEMPKAATKAIAAGRSIELE